MDVNIQAKMKRAQQINNWNDAESLVDALIEEAGLTSEDEAKRQVDAGRRAANYMNAKQFGTSFEGSVPGKKV